ncbi:MAG TPA: branched-chain amino acid ABC transporter permease [Anaeromyxobacteraceae bacterium]|nr:branched-chain amino acid ABC transporter permease [Anaeromyxobacteraceae bacterium]
MSTAAKPGARRRRLVTAGALAALALYPLAAGGFYLDLVTKVMILAIFALSLDLLVGYTGLVSFGHAAFFGVGAYTLALAAPRYEAASLWLTLPAAVLAAGVAALVVGALVLRVRGVYFIMVTLAFAQMFYFVFHDTELGRGSDGITLNFRPEARLAGVRLIDLGSETHTYYLVLAAMVAVYVFLRTLLRSPLGHALRGIRWNEHRMLSLGFPVFRYKLASFTLAGALAGLAGYLSALQFGFVNPELLSWHQSGNVLLILILGGLGSLRGAVVGAFAFVLLQELFQTVTVHWQLLFGGTILLVVAFLPGGLGSVTRRVERGLIGGLADE